ncbi:hypothetical protein ACJMK2_009112 [Sinanodonta woodiana]|uniref:Uncharacterized protein n=1 Tax=Sinanodonta woodiana TaxID=1069815 RepID=A0ABD3VDJ5_SINWO
MGLAVLVSGYPKPIGHERDILEDGFLEDSVDSRNFGYLDYDNRDNNWNIPYYEDNIIYDEPVDGFQANKRGISGDNWKDTNNDHNAVGSYTIQNYGTNGEEIAGFISF